MKNETRFSKKLKKALKITHPEWKQTHLAKAAGISKGSLNHYFNSIRTPKEEVVEKIADALGLNKRWFYDDADDEPEVHYTLIPLIKFWHLDRDWRNNKEWVDIYPIKDTSFSKNSFALNVEGSSMLPEFADSALIIVDPERDAKNGDYIIALIDKERGFTFKKLEIDAGKKMLVPLNRQFPPIPFTTQTEIIGVVVAQIISKKY